MIYLASDDSYFALGIAAILGSNKRDVKLTKVNMEKLLLREIEFTREDTLLIDVDQTDIITCFLASAHIHGAKVLLIIDSTPVGISSWPRGVLSKKVPIGTLLYFLNSEFSYIKELPSLTNQEIKVMSKLTTGKTPQNISKELNLSVKTVYSHKLNALRKLKLDNLNARSIFIFAKIYHGLPLY